MATTNATITMYAGNYRKLLFTITDEDNGGVAKDLTGQTVKFALSKVNADGDYKRDPVFEYISTGPEITITDAANGLLEVEIAGADTDALKGTYYYELELFDGGGNSLVVAVGEIEILLNIDNTL